MKLPKYSVMVDLETMSTQTNPAILTVAAIHFDKDNILGDFTANVDLQSCIDVGLTIDAATIIWWMHQRAKARKGMFIDPSPIKTVLQAFTEWLPGTKITPPSIWGNGAVSDCVWLKEAYRACGLEKPWSYKNEMCYRTVTSLYPDIEIARVGVAHNALDDCYNQIRLLQKIINLNL
jgi:hypothetical protein